MSGFREGEPILRNNLVYGEGFSSELSAAGTFHSVRDSKGVLDALDYTAAIVVNRTLDNTIEKFEKNPPLKTLRSAIAVLACSGLLAIVGHGEVKQESENTAAIECINPDCTEKRIISGEKLLSSQTQNPVETHNSSPTEPNRVAKESETKPADPKPAAPEQQSSLENIAKMRLTREGLTKTLSSVNTDLYAYAQSKPKFNPAEMARQGIPQGPTEFYTLHVTAENYNSDGSVLNVPLGAANPTLFIDKITGRNDNRCCAVNQFIDRNATIYWLAPHKAKLRHNPGYDGRTTGKEIEGYLVENLTTRQLEASAYLDIGNLIKDGLEGKPLDQTIKGHAETRSNYNAANPGSARSVKIDFEEGPTNQYRQKLTDFIAANQDFRKLIPKSFLELP